MLRECVPRKPGDGSARRRPQHAARGGTSRAKSPGRGGAQTQEGQMLEESTDNCGESSL